MKQDKSPTLRMRESTEVMLDESAFVNGVCGEAGVSEHYKQHQKVVEKPNNSNPIQ